MLQWRFLNVLDVVKLFWRRGLRLNRAYVCSNLLLCHWIVFILFILKCLHSMRSSIGHVGNILLRGGMLFTKNLTVNRSFRRRFIGLILKFDIALSTSATCWLLGWYVLLLFVNFNFIISCRSLSIFGKPATSFCSLFFLFFVFSAIFLRTKKLFLGLSLIFFIFFLGVLVRLRLPAVRYSLNDWELVENERKSTLKQHLLLRAASTGRERVSHSNWFFFKFLVSN